MKALYFLTTCIVMLWSSIYAQPGSPDLSLDGDGSVTKVIVEEHHAWGNHIINYPNDRYVVTGSSNTSSFGVGVLYRFHEDGSVDSSFNGTGSIILQYPDQDVSGTLSYVMEDGRILTLTNVWNDDTGGATLLWMFNEDGTPDHDFGDYGVKFLDLGYYWEGFYTLAIQPDGKILLAGYGAPLSSEYYEFIVARFHPDGSPDESFDDDGITKKIIGESWSSVSSLLLLPGGKFYVAGYAVFDSIEQFTLVRYNNNGTIDKTFNGDGIAHHGIANASAFADKAILQPDGKIVLCGSASYSSSDNVMAAMRFTANGELDPTFHGDGIGLYPHTSKCGAWSAVIQPDGKLNLAGYSHPTNDGSDMCMLRILPNGLPDFSFGKEGFVDFAVNPENSETITHMI